LRAPWQVVSVGFDVEAKRVDLRVDFPKGSMLCCRECDRCGLKAHDTEGKAWRHLDFFQHQAYRTARVPRVRLNSLIQAAKRRARGYRTNPNFIAMIYLIVGKPNAGPATA
jgi:transposase